MTDERRPTELMAPTPSMQWADHIDTSRKSKVVLAAIAVGVLCAAAGVLLGIWISA